MLIRMDWQVNCTIRMRIGKKRGSDGKVMVEWNRDGQIMS